MTLYLPFRGDTFQFPGFDVSWVGDGPYPGSVYFGSEDGRLMQVAVDRLVAKNEFQAAKSNEAINGAACVGPHLAVTTRSEVTIWSNLRSTEESWGKFPAGAHGVVATASGQFVVTLGRAGLLLVKPSSGHAIPMKLINQTSGDLYFYRTVSLDSTAHPETLVCATRHGGIAAIVVPRPDTERIIFSSTFPGLDVIDICSLGSGLAAPAVCALGEDCTLVFFRDVLDDRKPVTLKFDRFQGTAYRLMSAKGHLFVLTSSSLYMFMGLTSRFVAGEPIELLPTLVREFKIEAVDANVLHDRWLLIVTTDGGVLRFDVDELVGQASMSGPAQPSHEFSPTLMAPDWAMRQATFADLVA